MAASLPLEEADMQNPELEATLRFGTQDTVFPSISNVLRVFHGATPIEHMIGASWYRNEHDYGRAIADTHWSRSSPRTIKHALGIMAALAPMVPWDYAKQLALVCYRERGLTGGHYGAFVEKANAIYYGAEPLEVLGGPKTRAFYQALSTAGEDPEVVVIDRHALHASVGTILDSQKRSSLLRVSQSHNGYEHAAGAYRRAAKVLGKDLDLELTPSQVQAIVWVTWRNWLLGEQNLEEKP